VSAEFYSDGTAVGATGGAEWRLEGEVLVIGEPGDMIKLTCRIDGDTMVWIYYMRGTFNDDVPDYTLPAGMSEEQYADDGVWVIVREHARVR
jgi:hypothetical protein